MFLILFALAFVEMMVTAFILVQLWGWYVVPFGAPALTIPWAIGLSLIVGFHQAFTIRMAERDDFSKGEMLVGRFTFYGFILLVGWIVQMFM